MTILENTSNDETLRRHTCCLPFAFRFSLFVSAPSLMCRLLSLPAPLAQHPSLGGKPGGFQSDPRRESNSSGSKARLLHTSRPPMHGPWQREPDGGGRGGRELAPVYRAKASIPPPPSQIWQLHRGSQRFVSILDRPVLPRQGVDLLGARGAGGLVL